jgi:hypothetical protein
MPHIIETMNEFEARHSKDGPKLGDVETSRELFADGAMRDAQGNGYEPPTEPGELLRAKRRYVALKLRLEKDVVEAVQKKWIEEASNRITYSNHLPGPPPNAKELLEEWNQGIAKIRKELEAIDHEISKLPDEVARRASFEHQRQRQQSARGQLSEIVSVVI